MRLRNHSLAFFTMFLLGAAAFLGGCVTTGMDRSVKTSNSIKEVDSDIRKINIQIDVTAKSLDSILNAGQPDLKKAFDTYSDEVAELDSQGKKVLKHIDEMKSRSTEYFAEWQKQGETYTNPQIRELSDERRNKLAEIYARVPTAGAGIKRAYLAYLVDLKEIQTYLSNDLTPDGITAITPVAEKSDQDAEALKTSLEPVLTALDEINAELYSGKK
jgi:chromosome segregation ATPase